MKSVYTRGRFPYAWDLTDANGETALPGEYMFFVEGTLRWKNYVLYSGVIDISGGDSTVLADVDYVYETSDRQVALTSDSPENSMIVAVTASFTPVS